MLSRGVVGCVESANRPKRSGGQWPDHWTRLHYNSTTTTRALPPNTVIYLIYQTPRHYTGVAGVGAADLPETRNGLRSAFCCCFQKWWLSTLLTTSLECSDLDSTTYSHADWSSTGSSQTAVARWPVDRCSARQWRGSLPVSSRSRSASHSTAIPIFQVSRKVATYIGTMVPSCNQVIIDYTVQLQRLFHSRSDSWVLEGP